MKVLFCPLLHPTCLFLVVVCCLLFACQLILLVCCIYLLVQYGETALMGAARYGRTAMVAFLVERGADLDLRDDVSKPNKT